MKYKELTILDEKELKQHLLGFKKEYFNLRMRKVSNNLENTARIGQVKKVIARINTCLNDRGRIIQIDEKRAACQKES
jgi:large subunit ribosomal protein L29